MRQRANIAEGRQKKEEKAERSTETWEIGERFFWWEAKKKKVEIIILSSGRLWSQREIR